MKTAIFVIVLFIGISATVNAQTSSKKMKKEKPKLEMGMKMKEGVIMSDNKVILCKNHKYTPLTETYTCTDEGKFVSYNGR